MTMIDVDLYAGDIMTPDVVTVSPDTSLRWAATLLAKYQISEMPVVDCEDHLLGMIGETELVIGTAAFGKPCRWWLSLLAGGFELSPDFLKAVSSDTRKVRDVMVSDVFSAEKMTPVREVARLIVAKNVKNIPIIDDNRVIGILSRTDLIRSIAGAYPASR